MTNLRCVPLVASLLSGLYPVAAIASEAHLTPGANGGSGAMPSGYSKLYFELSDDDWVAELKLPDTPVDGDRVVVSSTATRPARLDPEGMSVAILEYVPVVASSSIELRWNNWLQEWHLIDGMSTRVEVVTWSWGVAERLVTSTDHALTELYVPFNSRGRTLKLPQWAPSGALLSVNNYGDTEVTVRDGVTTRSCGVRERCPYVFDAAEGSWSQRSGRVEISAFQTNLPVPTNRWTTVRVGSPVDDLTTPGILRLPREGKDGDIYQINNASGDHFAYILADNTSLREAVPVSSGSHTFRFDAVLKTWLQQPN
ncbi:hypothetical protein [Stenotrophomonas maltophilia]|uniref:hypothetical protein n=1 Tax=Stenotrophomonas maltophilia TaxID=40324 RepID=UPI00021E0B1B|nr:hypothetical protein [Stenotrophomonas maltophilia]AEM51483.1 hypothetical protein BurJV3_2160 [Stenotrophomonas maltophilia JV3]